MRYLPIHLDTRNQKILIIGGDSLAASKLRSLIKSEAVLVVVSTTCCVEIQDWAEQGRIRLVKRDWQAKDLQDVCLLYVAGVDERQVELLALARRYGILVNVADKLAPSDFLSPALVDRAPLTISIGTEGHSPALGRALKADLEQRLPVSVGALVASLAGVRETVALRLSKARVRQRFWNDLFAPHRLMQRLQQKPAELTADIERKLSIGVTSPGSVFLVGAGPGDMGLLTLRAQAVLHQADVIVYDRLISSSVLDCGRREADYVYVGKQAGKRSVSQAQINKILIEKAQAGLQVVRLKSGDPLIFGRADDELSALRSVGIDCTVIPGITAAAAAAAVIGCSLTHRGENKAVTLMTGHDADGFAEHDWKYLASEEARAAIYMGVGAARFIQGRLLLHGARADKAIVLVEKVSHPDQRIVSTCLGQLSQTIKAQSIRSPAVILLGYGPHDISMHIPDLKKQLVL